MVSFPIKFASNQEIYGSLVKHVILTLAFLGNVSQVNEVLL